MYRHTSDQDIDFDDLQEAPLIPRTSGYRPVIAGICAAFLGLVLVVILIRGSMPELSPEEIVAMEGYQGRQLPRYIFNLDSLNTDKPVVPGEAESQYVAAATGTANTSFTKADDLKIASATAADQANDAAIDSTPSLNVANPGKDADIIAALLDTVEPEDTWPLEIAEIPASPIMFGKEAQQVAAPFVEQFDYRKLNRRKPSRRELAQSQEAQNPEAQEIGGQPQEDGLQASSASIRVLPVLGINQDFSYLRAGPSHSADILLSLDKGSSITAFELSGAWIHAGANDGSSITGYVHRSNVEITDIN